MIVRRKFFDLFVNIASLPTLLTLVVILSGAVYAEHQNNLIFQQQNQAEVLNRANLIASRLQGRVNANIELVRGLASTVATEPDIDQTRFGRLAKSLFLSDNQLSNIAGAPDLIISLMYPIEGNEKAIGLDYNKNDAQREVALRARDTGKMTLAGPVNLVQGGQGFIARFPVFNYNEVGERRFWGILSSVISTEKLYAESGLTAVEGLDFALIGKDASGPGGELFYGSADILSGKPVRVQINLPNGSWELAVLPHGGWQKTAPNAWIIRTIALLAALLVALPISMMSWLFRDRNQQILAHKMDQKTLDMTSERLNMALETSQIGIWDFRIDAAEVSWDVRMRELYGCSPDEVIEISTWADRLHPDDRARVIAEYEKAIIENSKFVSEFRALLPNGEVRTIRAIGARHQDVEGNIHIVGVNWDITADIERTEMLNQARAESDKRYLELEVANARIESNSLHDFLTGLPNRRYLDEKLHGNFDFGFTIDGQCGLLKIDLDRFKEINDTLGHAAGDAMLVHAAGILRKNARPSDFVARIGGDEFIILCRSMHEEDRLQTLAADIVEQMKIPVEYEGRKCRLGASIGIAHGASAQAQPDKLLSNADLALYQAKDDGRSCYRFFTQKMHHVAVETRLIADDILSGIERGEFIAFFQGQFDARTHALTGVEALARWNHPERGILPPAVFIDIAENLNVMGQIDAMILEHSIAEMAVWDRAGLHVPRVSVNVSAKRLNDEDLVPSLRKLDFMPGRLTFELVESTFLDQSDDIVSWNIDQIRELGIEIEIDDFGTAYASIISLTQLRPHRLKIDRQLVMPIVDDVSQRELVKSIIGIGDSMGIGIVAEGVETLAHADILRDLGCQTLQGFAFAKPISSEDFLAIQKNRLTA